MRNLPDEVKIIACGVVAIMFISAIAGISGMTQQLLTFVLVTIGLVSLVFYVNFKQDWGETPA